MMTQASHTSSESQTRSALHFGRAAAATAVSGAFVFLLAAGVWRCPSAALFHVACPACGSTRAMRALFTGLSTGHFQGVLLNPLAPLMSLALGAFLARAIWLELTDGHLHRLGAGFGLVLTRAFLVIAVLEIVLWGFRLFGYFGGPVPV